MNQNHAHNFLRISDTDMPHIQSGICDCGLVHYYAEVYWDTKGTEKNQKKAIDLNSKAEAEWRKTQVNITEPAAVVTKASSSLTKPTILQTYVKTEHEVTKVSADNKDTKVTNVSDLPPVPEQPEIHHRQAIHKYYEDNALQIIEEVKQHGSQTIQERWKFGAVTWYQFCEKHGIQLPHGGNHHKYPAHRKSAVKETVNNKSEKDTGVHGTSASFPSFNNDWPAEVQIKWLEVYKELTIAGAFHNGKET